MAFLEFSCLTFACKLLAPGPPKLSCCRPVLVKAPLGSLYFTHCCGLVTNGPLGEWFPMSGSSVFSVADVEPSLKPASTENPPTVGWIVHFWQTSFSKSLVAWEEASLFLSPPRILYGLVSFCHETLPLLPKVLHPTFSEPDD